MENQQQCSSGGVNLVLLPDGQKLTLDIESCVSDLLQKYPGFDWRNQLAKYPVPSLSVFGGSHGVGLESGENSVKIFMFPQDSTQDQISPENSTCITRSAKATKPPRPPLLLDVKRQSALSNSTIVSSNSFIFLTSPTTNRSSSGAYKSSNYLSPILKRRSLGWSGQRLAGIGETSAVCTTTGTPEPYM